MNLNIITDQKNPKILAIETSCDETAISFLHDLKSISHHVHTQATMHAEFGGVFPNLAKREHAKNLIPVLSLVFKDIFDNEIWSADLSVNNTQQKNHSPNISENSSQNISAETQKNVTELLAREGNLGTDLLAYIGSIPNQIFIKIKEGIDAIAVTYGPGLEPALWVGISFAKALSVIFDKPLMPINHMEGHIASVLAIAGDQTSIQSETSSDTEAKATKTEEYIAEKSHIDFPAIALLISGGHTELVQINSWHDYKILGQTVDDAVGEAYDKTARLIGLPYPGGPAISALASKFREENNYNWPEKIPESNLKNRIFELPRPMLHSKDFNFSFSGLKTAVLYAVRDNLNKKNSENLSNSLTDNEKIALAGEFEDAVVEVLTQKTNKAIEEIGAQTLIIGGGVIANTYIRESFKKLTDKLGVKLLIPEISLATDNASMIGLVATLKIKDGQNGLVPNSKEFAELKADGNLGF